MTQERQQNSLRARGNLTYTEFIRLVQNLWSQVHADIPIRATGARDDAVYPCILYGLESRQPHTNESKHRLRETLEDENGVPYSILGQRLDNLISFAAVTEKDPLLAEEIMETFELFMLEMTPLFKEMGVSEFLYHRRLPDSEQDRPGEGVVQRRVVYMVVLERIAAIKRERIEQMMIRARLTLSQDMKATEGDPFMSHLEPRYYSTGQPPTFYQSLDDVNAGLITVPFTSFHLNDRVYVGPLYGQVSPPNLTPGFYLISDIVEGGVPFSSSVKYRLSMDDDEMTPITDYGDPGTPDNPDAVYFGKLYYIPDPKVESELVDEQQEGVSP